MFSCSSSSGTSGGLNFDFFDAPTRFVTNTINHLLINPLKETGIHVAWPILLGLKKHTKNLPVFQSFHNLSEHFAQDATRCAENHPEYHKIIRIPYYHENASRVSMGEEFSRNHNPISRHLIHQYHIILKWPLTYVIKDLIGIPGKLLAEGCKYIFLTPFRTYKFISNRKERHADRALKKAQDAFENLQKLIKNPSRQESISQNNKQNPIDPKIVKTAKKVEKIIEKAQRKILKRKTFYEKKYAIQSKALCTQDLQTDLWAEKEVKQTRPTHPQPSSEHAANRYLHEIPKLLEKIQYQTSLIQGDSSMTKERYEELKNSFEGELPIKLILDASFMNETDYQKKSLTLLDEMEKMLRKEAKKCSSSKRNILKHLEKANERVISINAVQKDFLTFAESHNLSNFLSEKGTYQPAYPPTPFIERVD